MAALDETDEAEDIFDPGLFLNEDYAEHAYELGDGAQQTCLCLEGASTDHDLTGQIVVRRRALEAEARLPGAFS